MTVQYHEKLNVYFTGGAVQALTPCPVAPAHTLLAGTKIYLPCLGVATVLPDMDFETYSAAGFVWNGKKYYSIAGPGKKAGLLAVGASRYAEHPSAEIICLAYNLKDGRGAKLWIPGNEPPRDLFDYLAQGGLIEAHNSYFEFILWHYVCCLKYGWPALPLHQLRDSQAKAVADSLPMALAKIGPALGEPDLKDPEGVALIKKFTYPRTPTIKDPRHRIQLADEPEAAQQFYGYCVKDTEAESHISAHIPDLSPIKLQAWLLSQQINVRGIAIDTVALEACASIIEQQDAKYAPEVAELSGGAFQSVKQGAALIRWLEAQGVRLPDVKAETVDIALERPDLPANVRRMLELRKILALASIAKVGAMQRTVSSDGRLRDLFVFYGGHTGRYAGRGAQPQNITKDGPPVLKCDDCGRHYHLGYFGCPWCPCCLSEYKKADWGIGAMEDALGCILTGRLDIVEHYFGKGQAAKAVSGCLRGLFISADGRELVCSDYSSIEAVVLAVLAGEQWRVDVFKTHGKIYEMSAAQLTGLSLEQLLEYRRETGHHHPSRPAAKIAELASGYGGGVKAWVQFAKKERAKLKGAKDLPLWLENLLGEVDTPGVKISNGQRVIREQTRADILVQVRKWRDSSPNIVAYWKGLEQCAFACIYSPGEVFEFRGIGFQVRGGSMFVRLLSGREIRYHAAKIRQGPAAWDKTQTVDKITFEGVDALTKKWLRKETYGGRLCENVVQATAYDILQHAMHTVTDAGYPIVMHVHDEIVSEVPEGFGSVEEFEQLMQKLPSWAEGWPIKAAGGWRGRRYRKD